MRNDIVHGAASPENLQRLTQHLQLYAIRLILAVSNLLEKDNGIDTVDDAISVIDTCYHNWIDDLRRMGSGGNVYGSNEIKNLSAEEVLRVISPPFGLHL